MTPSAYLTIALSGLKVRGLNYHLGEERRGRTLELTLTLGTFPKHDPPVHMDHGVKAAIVRESYHFADNELMDKEVVYDKLLTHLLYQGCIFTVNSGVVATIEETT